MLLRWIPTGIRCSDVCASVFRKCRSETMLKYKGYTGYVVYDDEARIFHGEIAAIRTVITFQGTTVDEIEQAFKDSIDDYLEWCVERNKTPEKPHSGKFNLRMPADIYVKVVVNAAHEGLSINSYILKKISF